MEPRSKSKYKTVTQALRFGITRGTYAPGGRLPTHSEIGAEFGVGAATVQKALDALIEDGFVHTRARAGTFVVNNPPHLTQYGLVTPATEKWSMWHLAIHKAAAAVQNETCQFRAYVTSDTFGNREGIRRLSEDVLKHKVAGLILTGCPSDLVGTAVMEYKGIPRVRTVPLSGPEDIPLVHMDTMSSFLPKAITYLTGRGRRRIAHIRLISHISERKQFDEALGSAGIEVRDYWTQSVSQGTTGETVPNLVRLLMHLKGEDRPDALIIHDDNLVEHVVTGLMTAGVKVPDDLEIVAHFNYPTLAASTLPMTRLGFDCRCWLRKCVERLEMQRKGLTPPMETTIPAIFEDELADEV